MSKKPVRNWRSQSGNDNGYVGFYGCEAEDRVIRVGLTTRVPGKQMALVRKMSFRIECPCGKVHTTKPMWRRLLDGEKRRAEVLVRRKDGITPPRRGKGSSTRAPV